MLDKDIHKNENELDENNIIYLNKEALKLLEQELSDSYINKIMA